MKRESHILFDHLQGYYGVSSLEGLSQGLCVIAGLDKWNTQCIKEFTGTQDLPWVIARNQEELQRQLQRVVADKDMRNHICANSRRFMERYWHMERVLRVLFQVYK